MPYLITGPAEVVNRSAPRSGPHWWAGPDRGRRASTRPGVQSGKGTEDGGTPTVPYLHGTESALFPRAWEVTPEQLRSYLGTNSAVMRLPDQERERRLGDAEELVARVCVETGRPTAALHQATLCFRWRPACPPRPR